ncbi:MAG: PDGLE domain-containing protein [bacterium]
MHRLWKIIILLVILSPLGIIIPYLVKAGSAWGEWGPDEIKELIGYVPAGLERLSSLGRPLLPDYNLKGWEGKPLTYQSIGYIISGLIGVGIVAGVAFLIGRALSRR